MFNMIFFLQVQFASLNFFLFIFYTNNNMNTDIA